MIYQCDCCGEFHDTWPALAFRAPFSYTQLSFKEKQEIAMLSADFCIIEYPEQTDRFIRATMKQKVLDHCNFLEYGVWVSLSEKNFLDYYTNYDNDNHIVEYFGWLSNSIPNYEDTHRIRTTVHTKPNGQRPEIVPYPDQDHPFVKAYYEGITKVEAEHRIAQLFGRQRNN